MAKAFLTGKKKAHKFKAKPVWQCQHCNATYFENPKHCCGPIEYFPSKGQFRRYQELKMLERAGSITGLRHEVPFDLHAYGGHKIGKYVADFVYQEDGKQIVEDFKGFSTELFRWKRRHLKAEYGISIRMTSAPTRRK